MDQVLRRCTENLLISVTVCFILGSSIAYIFAAPLAPLPLAAIILPLVPALALVAIYLTPRLRPLSTLPLFFLLGLLHVHLALQPVSDPHHISRIVTEKSKVTLVGRILTMVVYDGEKSRFELATEEILFHDLTPRSSFQPVRGTVQLSVQGDLSPTLTPGMKIMAITMIDRIRNYQTPGVFNYPLQMATKSISCSGWVRSTKEILPVREPPLPFEQGLRFLPEQMRQRIALFLSQEFEPDIAGIYQALLIGSMANISPQLMESFKENGCVHVLSISGLHLSLLGLFSVIVLAFLLKRSQWLLLHTHVPTLALILTAPLLFFYTFIAGMNIPAIRALVTALLVLSAVVLRRQRSLIHLIAAAALIVLAMTPLALFTASFQLSFAAVLAINCIYPRLPLVIAAPESGSKRNLRADSLRFVQSMLYVSLAATAGTLPFMLYHFNRFSLIGPVMNLLIEPLLCLWALPCGLLGILLLSISPAPVALLFQIGGAGIRLALVLTKAVAGLPYASIWTITPSLLEILLFFALLFLLLQRKPTSGRLTLAMVFTFVLLFSFTLSLWHPAKSKEVIVSFLDVGQGSATLLQLPSGKNILIDGGGHQTDRFNIGQSIIAPYLWRKRIWRLDDLVITHPHKDHYNGLPFVHAHFQPQRLIVNGDRGDEPAYGQLMETVRKKGTPILIARTGDKLQQDKDLLLECLGMNDLIDHSSGWSINDRSLVLRLQFGERSFLFPADIGIQSEDRLMQKQDLLRSDVLLAPHHGSKTSAGQDFLAAVSPTMIVVSAGRASGGILPAPKHLEDWRQKKILSLVTAQQGTTTCTTDGKSLRTDTFTGDLYVLNGEGEEILKKK